MMTTFVSWSPCYLYYGKNLQIIIVQKHFSSNTHRNINVCGVIPEQYFGVSYKGI